MENNENNINMKKQIDMINEKLKEEPDHILGAVKSALIKLELIDREGNIIENSEYTGKRK